MKNLFKSWWFWGFALLVVVSSFGNNQSLNSSPQTVSATNQYQQVDSTNKLNAQTKPTEAPTENGTTSTSEVETTPDNTVATSKITISGFLNWLAKSSNGEIFLPAVSSL